MRKHSRRFSQILQKVEKEKVYSHNEAVSLLQGLSSVNFIETLEAHISLGLDPKYADQQLRATVILPKGTGKNVRVAVITKGDKIDEALSAGADIVGSEELIEEIIKGRLDFDKLIATPDVMLLIAKLGRVLGPRGLMPSPKAGTVTMELSNAISEFKSGKLEYRLDRTGILHVPLGKLNFSMNDLSLNLKALQDSVDKNRPSGSKGKYWKSCYLSSTMGPSIPININSLRDSKVE
uniref:Ribosomal protein n=1 Tax=Campylaephora sungminbooi TaxID=1896769 RepID=A0A1B0TI39_9FLOR|nr:50S ribosomal protein L1 [Campylaephora sungminbooi]AKU47378.1 50S ribosomal protein L1 [Campylaephora sungminbooi]ALN11825.1 50S ribosomal protein L1 [Campylaephora sungminbooi]